MSNKTTHATSANQTPTTSPKLQSWVSVYRVFLAIADTVLELPEGINHDDAHEIINDLVNTLAMSHEDEEAWSTAYHRWIEPSDDDEEV